MAEANNDLLETVGHLQQTDELTGRFLATRAAELRTWDSMFDLMKLETGGFELDIQEVDFKQLVERVMGLVSDYMKTIYGEMEESRQETVRPKVWYIMPAELPLVQIDKLRIERLLMEILLAAVQISRSRQGKVRVSVESEPDWLLVEISDNGVGLPEHLINYRPNLPLPSEAIVKKHGGNLSIKNRARGGWVVYLNLPIGVQQAEFDTAVRPE
jgi:signal transduction histidine kinase